MNNSVIQNSQTAGSMHLTDEEQAMLRGDKGSAIQEAIQYQIEVGSFFEAKRFVPITHAHVMGDIEVMGDGGLEHLRSMGEKHAKCSVPTSSNAQCMHFHEDPRFHQDQVEEEKEREIAADKILEQEELFNDSQAPVD